MAQSKRPGSRLPQHLLSGGNTLLGALPGLAPTFVIVALLACVLVPLPTGLVDLLLSLSLAGAVLLLVASLGVRRSADFLSFPALLLLVTLYRLAINVSTTRLILSQADAGQVVDAFATFVVRNDLIVGGVMFAIISVIQYLVIARGAERVAEVAARFALDALPGHQQAIEADLRAGLVSPTEAARRRARLVERSSFHGAMDGAIRFVKGDAIAGLAITGINLVGGLAIGVGRMGYSWQESLEIYGRLTIGDGLLAQIPALLVSLAAGVLVSRVDDGDDQPSTRLRWLQPAMLLVPAILLFMLALVPGMPSVAFAFTALVLFGLALLLAARVARLQPTSTEGPEEIRLQMHPDAIDDARGLERALAELQGRCHGSLGIEVPPLVLVLDPDAPPDRWELRIGRRLLKRASVDGQTTVDAMLLAVFRAVMDHAPSLVDLQDLEDGLEALRATHPVLVRRALEVVEPVDLLEILRSFLRERLRRPPLAAILGAIGEDRRFRDPAERPRFAEHVRERLASHWVPEVIDAVHRLGPPRWVRLSPDAEEALAEYAVPDPSGWALRLGSQERARWLDNLRKEPIEAEANEPSPRESSEGPAPSMSTIARLGAPGTGPLVLVTTPRARPAAAALVAGSVPHVPVLSTIEIERSSIEQVPKFRWLDPPA